MVRSRCVEEYERSRQASIFLSRCKRFVRDSIVVGSLALMSVLDDGIIQDRGRDSSLECTLGA